MGVWRQNTGKGGATLTQRTRLYFEGFYVCANFGENRSRNATVRVRTDGQTDRRTDANQFYNLSRAIYAIDMGQIIKN